MSFNSSTATPGNVLTWMEAHWLLAVIVIGLLAVVIRLVIKDGLRQAFTLILAFFMWLHMLWVPILIALVVALLPGFVLFKVGPANLVRGAYETGPWGFGCIVLVLGLIHGSLVLNSRLIWKHGVQRLGLPVEPVAPWLRWTLYVVYLAGPVLTVGACLMLRYQMPDTIQWRPSDDPAPRPSWLYYVFAGVGGLLGAVLAHFLAGLMVQSQKLRSVRRKIDAWCALLGPGYTATGPGGRPVAAPEHAKALLFAVVTLVFFGLFSLMPRHVPPAGFYVLMLLLALSWLLACVSFFLMRFRVPLYLLAFAWLWIGQLWRPEYTFQTVKIESGGFLPDPGSVLGTPEKTDENGHLLYSGLKGSPVCVAAVGGGIHSGAWEVEVLTRLQELHNHENEPACATLPEHIALLSGTSGGAYGAMFYAHVMYRPGQPRSGEELEKLRAAAQSSSLSSVVGALTYHDLSSYCFPIVSGDDRGEAMERAWISNAKSAWREDKLGETTLQDWAQKTHHSKIIKETNTFAENTGSMPAVLFTSGTEESGRPVIFGTSQVADWNFNARQNDIPAPMENGSEKVFPWVSVGVVTGARLSATFPWVSPAARPDSRETRRAEHQLDGGFYDNFGIAALNRWLDDGLKNIFSDPAKDPKEGIRARILVIQIRYLGGERKEPVSAGDGFFHQVLAPLLGLYKARESGQRLRADELFDEFCAYWKLRGVEVSNAAFAWPDVLPETDTDTDPKAAAENTGTDGAPLSWHLTQRERYEMTRRGKAIQDQYEYFTTNLSRIETMRKERDAAYRARIAAPEKSDQWKKADDEWRKADAGVRNFENATGLGAAAAQVVNFLRDNPVPVRPVP